MVLILRTLRHPGPYGLFLLLRQFLMGKGGWHDMRVLGEDALDDLAMLDVAGHNRRALGFRLQGLFAEVEAHICHARTGIRSVTTKAGVGHDRPDIAIKGNLSPRFGK